MTSFVPREKGLVIRDIVLSNGILMQNQLGINRKSKKDSSFFHGISLRFTKRVYAVVSRIPAGRTRTYQEVARMAGSPRAYRAVGNILNKNRSPLVPCHRVIRSDGGMGGYALGGKRKKRAILKREGAL